ncbi:MAG: hypothetical protein CME71_05010 [Halobacteriovorax sp.]|nr:hypothetical protein [Halobacteriovorax sp.]
MSNTFRFVHVDHQFALHGDGVKSGTPAYAHAAVIRSMIRIRALCEEEVLEDVNGLEKDLSAIVINQHEQYSQIILVDPNTVDETKLDEELLALCEKHKLPPIDGTDPSQRIFPRYETKLELSVIGVAGEEIKAQTHNISLDGICLNLEKSDALTEGEIIEINIVGKSRQISLNAHVAWVFNTDAGSSAGVYLKFSETTGLNTWLKFILAHHLNKYPSQTI